MKKHCALFLALLFATAACAQNSWHPIGEQFVKRIENSSRGGGRIDIDEAPPDNTTFKEGAEKLLLGDCNGRMEFFVEPSFSGAYGFRLTNDKRGCVVEIKTVSNYGQVREAVVAKYPLRGGYPKDDKDDIALFNREQSSKMREESLRLYKVRSRTLRVSDSLAAAIYDNTADLVVGYRGGGVPVLVNDGAQVAFRFVRDYEVWSLYVNLPNDDQAKRLYDIFKRLIEDAADGKIDESEYWESLAKR